MGLFVWWVSDELEVRGAVPGDVARIRAMVDAAYSKYVERLGTLPAAMTADVGALVAAGELYVLWAGELVVGSVRLEVRERLDRVEHAGGGPFDAGAGLWAGVDGCGGGDGAGAGAGGGYVVYE